MTKQRNNQWQWVFILVAFVTIATVIYSSGSKVQSIESRSKENRNLINKANLDDNHRFNRIDSNMDRMEDKIDDIRKAVK